MSAISWPDSQDILVGFETNDDAGVYRISGTTAIVQTIDFITPVVNDPYLYGQIAAANSLSDIFAMGAKFHTALNLVAYDSCNVTKDMLKEILKGGLSKIKEAGGVVLGGHTIQDLEMKYGLAATGLVRPDKQVRNNSIQPGDALILTKPLGLGVITTAIKADLASENCIKEAGLIMATLNKTASEIAVDYGVNAMTDVTGFGLAGHLYEMINSYTSIELFFAEIPVIAEAYEYAAFGLFPGGSHRNKDYLRQFVKINRELNSDQYMMLFDAQTSGGLVISLPEKRATKLLNKLKLAGIESAQIIGIVKEKSEDKIIVK